MDKQFIFKASDLNSKRTHIAELVLLFVKMQQFDDAFNNYQVAILREPHRRLAAAVRLRQVLHGRLWLSGTLDA